VEGIMMSDLEFIAQARENVDPELCYFERL
jgi:hypothetical protein